ncbi:iron-containing alcohol dehydrogenase [Clostridiaceae bacterium 35-E11]
MSNWKSYQLLMPKTILYGPGCLKSVGGKSKILGKKALIVTDSIMVRVGYVDKLKEILKEQDLDNVIFDKVNFEPTTTLIDEGVALFKKENCDFLVAIGGGSSIDAAKAIGAMATNQGNIKDYMGIDKILNPSPPIVVIATTSGTGSEVTKFTIISDEENNVKMLIGSACIVPTIAVNDPLLTISVPQKITAATGIDALCHAIEAFISKKGQPYTDVLALSAVRRISKYLRKAWADGDDLESRSEMMLASMEAGIAFSNASVTIIHGMSRPIGANFHIPHGISNAVLLSSCMEFAMMGAAEKFLELAEAMGENITGMSTMAGAKIAVDAMDKLCRDINIPSILGLGVDKERFLSLVSKMADDALDSGSPANTPRKATKEEIIEIYKKAL